MTLIEKFERLKISQKNTTATLNINLDAAIECEQIADDFAIGFAEWLGKLVPIFGSEYVNNSTKELLEIYKEEKGL